MKLFDVNVLVTSFRPDAPRHAAIRPWFEQQIAAEAAFGMADLALSGFLRVVTQPRIFDPPSEPAKALAFANYLRNQPNCVVIHPGPRHWRIFNDLFDTAGVKGNLVADAYFAALAIEYGCEWISLDRDFARFGALKWVLPPLDERP